MQEIALIHFVAISLFFSECWFWIKNSTRKGGFDLFIPVFCRVVDDQTHEWIGGCVYKYIYTYTHILFIAKLPFLQVGSPSPDTVEIVLVVSSQADGFINIKQNMPGDDDFIKTSLVILVCLKALSIFESFRSPFFWGKRKLLKKNTWEFRCFPNLEYAGYAGTKDDLHQNIDTPKSPCNS